MDGCFNSSVKIEVWNIIFPEFGKIETCSTLLYYSVKRDSGGNLGQEFSFATQEIPYRYTS
jgi:hypothetical protein